MYPYLTPAQMTVWYDQRRILQLLADDGTDAAIGDLSNTGSTAYILLANLILSVCAEVDSALQVGARYSKTDLEGIIANSLAPGATLDDLKCASLLNRLVADLTYGELISRRGFSADQMQAMCPRFAQAQQMLADLADGSRVFDLVGPISAGVPYSQKIGTNVGSSISHSPLFGRFPNCGGGYLYNYGDC